MGKKRAREDEQDGEEGESKRAAVKQVRPPWFQAEGSGSGFRLRVPALRVSEVGSRLRAVRAVTSARGKTPQNLLLGASMLCVFSCIPPCSASLLVEPSSSLLVESAVLQSGTALS